MDIGLRTKPIRTGILGGAFDPLHMGHILMANYLCAYQDIEEIWFVVTPDSCLSKKRMVTDSNLRLKMVEEALNILQDDKLVFSDIEFRLPAPVYTIDTIRYVKENYKGREFYLIIGSDKWPNFYQWYQSEILLREVPILIYPRKGYSLPKNPLPSVQIVDNAPILEISSTFIRKAIEKNKNIRHFLPESIYNFIIQHNLYHSDL